MKIIEIRECSVCGVNENEKRIFKSSEFGSILCHKHYMQLKRHGKILERTIYDPNKFVYKENYVEMIIFNKRCEEIERVKIDKEDVDNVKKDKWRLSSNGYIMNQNDKLLHRVLMGTREGYVVDHINKDKFDNRKSNLRNCSQSLNILNSKISKDNTSGIKGVDFHKASGKWRARIKYNGENKYLGIYENKEEAIKVRKEAENKILEGEVI